MARGWTLAAAAVVVTITLALTRAHPHPHPHSHPHTHGMCVVAGGSSGGPQHLLRGGLQHCLKGIKPLRQHRSVLRHCKNKVKNRLITDRRNFRKNLLDPETMAEVVAEAWEGVASCLVGRLELEAEDGTLDTKRLVRATAGMRGKDVWKVKYMRAMVISCASNASAGNATQQLKEVMECVRAGALEFCESKTAFARRWLQSAAEESVCSPVMVPPEPMEACLACAKELDVPKAACGEEINDDDDDDGDDDDDNDDEKNDSRIYYPDSLQLDPEEAAYAVRLCASERLGWYRPTVGFLYTELSDAVANFTGWDDIPQALENVTQAIVDCAPPYEGDAQVQVLLWSACFMRTFFDTCGFRSNLTALLFPGFHHMMGQEVKQLMRGLVELSELGEDDDDDDDDEEDAELVDAGLLERSMLLDGDAGAEGPRVRSAHMKDHSKKDSEKMDKSDSGKTDKQGVTTDSLEPATSAPSEDASSDVPEEPDLSGTPADPSGTPPVDAHEEGSGGGMDDTSYKPLPEPSPEAPRDAAEEEK